jgi:hypothetical protein
MRRMLFPIQSDGVKQNGLPKGVFEHGFFDKTLNYEQKVTLNILFSPPFPMESVLRSIYPDS